MNAAVVVLVEVLLVELRIIVLHIVSELHLLRDWGTAFNRRFLLMHPAVALLIRRCGDVPRLISGGEPSLSPALALNHDTYLLNELKQVDAMLRVTINDLLAFDVTEVVLQNLLPEEVN